MPIQRVVDLEALHREKTLFNAPVPIAVTLSHADWQDPVGRATDRKYRFGL